MVTAVKTRNRIREHRIRVGISQGELGRQVGLSEPTINRYECGSRKPTRDKMYEIAEALGVPLRDLFVDLSGSMNESGNMGANRDEGDDDVDGECVA